VRIGFRRRLPPAGLADALVGRDGDGAEGKNRTLMAPADSPAGRRLLLCDESGSSPPIGEQLLKEKSGPWATLTGPEGGFAETELDARRKLPFVCAVGLGPRVLRADTAALAALAVFQALRGDWARPRR